MSKPLFCKHCGVTIDSDDVDANIATWDVFRNVCSDCVEVEVNIIDPPKKK